MKHSYSGATLRRMQAIGGKAGRLLPGGLIMLLVLFGAVGARAQQQRLAPVLFQDDAAARNAAARSPLAASLRQSRPLTIDAMGMQAALATAPLEGRGATPLVFALPLPDGSTGHFRVVESPVMEPGLAAQFPSIKTYSGVGVDDPTASIRLDVTPRGFHAQVLSASGTVYIDPVSQTDQQHYLSFYHKDMAVSQWNCGVSTPSGVSAAQRGGSAARTVGTTLRTFRLAVAADGEYTAFHGGTVALGQAAIVTSINRVVGVYETELAVRMVLVANNASIVYTNAATDPYTNTSPSTLLSENQTNLDAVIGTANYDVGHVFTTGGGGLAGRGVVCSSTRKAQGETGLPAPVGDAYDIDYVAHELGHQFGGSHTFNSSISNCGGGNRSASTAYEPGSGSTIMAYAGICGTDDLQSHSDPFFHVVSFEEISAYLGTVSCGTTTTTGNTPPAITSLPISGKVMPIGTPFKLTAGATDVDGNALTYNWEEYDLGPSVSLTAAQVAGQSPPIFRSFAPTTSPTRYFPRLTDLLNNTIATGERLPTVSRNLNFRVTVRDNQKGVNSSSTVLISTTSNAGPFVVTAPNAAVSWVGLSTQTVTWDVAGTNTAPVSCTSVNIRLSTDGGLTYPTVLATNTQNDGSEAITVPNLPTTTARIMVEAGDNYFFDISNTNFTIAATAVPVAITSINRAGGNPTNSATVAFAVTFSGSVTGLSAANFALATTGSVSGASISLVSGSGSTYTVAVNTGTGSGTLGLNLVNATGLSPGISTALPFVGQVYAIDKTGPVVTRVTVPSNGIYVTGQDLVFTVNFNKAAIVNTAGGVPSLGLTVGTVVRQALYVGGSGTTGLVFRYFVVPGDSDSDGITVGTLVLNGGIIQDALGNSAVLMLNAVPSTAGVLVDTVNPSVVITSPAGPITPMSPIPVMVVFSKPVMGFTATDVSVTNGTVSALSGSGTTYALSITPAGPGTVTLNIAANQAQDAAGNGNTAAVPFSIGYIVAVTTAPVLTAPANNSQTATTTPTYSGTAPVGSTVNVYVDGSNIGFTTATGGVFNVLQPLALAQGAHTVYATAQLSGQSVSANSNTNTFTVDTIAPTVTLSSTASATTSTSPIPVTVLFSEAVADFEATDVTVANGTVSGFTGSGTSYAFNVTPTAPGMVTVTIAAGVAHDDAGNDNTAATPLIRVYAPVAANVRVLYQNDEPGQPTNNVIRPNLQLLNDGTTVIPYAELTIRYWLTVENFAALTTSVNYAELGTSLVQAQYVPLAAPRQGAFGYVEYSFLPGASNLLPGTGSGRILSSFNKNSWTNFDETDDYSYAPNSTYLPSNRITVYRNGILISGQEPASAPVVNSLKVYAENQSASATSPLIATLAQIGNLGNQPVPYSDLTVRYWYTPDGPSPVVGSVDYAALGNSNVTLATGQQGTQTYAELHFAAGAGALAPLSNSGDLLFRLHMNNWSAFNQANDYSYRPAAPLAEHPQMTIYRQGVLVYGTEPASAQAAARPSVADEVTLTTVLESFPNPFSNSVELDFSLSLAGKYSLAIYNAQGSLVETLATGTATAGELHHVKWQAANRASGLYLVRLTTAAGVHQMKLVKQ
ncbi:reprolysin-like metallopeptidase [Hymenobacter negativus]|uniref:T9SS type A sorting domain-containing protein n=1 Tax=Hymenobacter negativus TaxID=2795026 RepID=A0ABS3QIB8_9BACT|nr:cellulose binding domain-containing protein [Hymenobacter negativus]MBO2010978.1 T9SS type A sorting domain-containing protein [Hymenobacter negativus]